jgi:hypothetical protein
MSKIKFQGNASGTGVLTITSPNTNNDRTITLPDENITLGGGVDGIVSTANATAMTINSDENIGIGVVPEVTHSSHDALQVGGNGNWSSYGTQGAGGEMDFQHNAYYAPSGNDKYISTDEATKYRQGGGVHRFYTAPSGSGDSAITWTQRARIDSDGLKFNNDSATANALDDYEEGTYTPVFKDTNNASMNGSLHSCLYTKIGRLVHVMIYYSVGDSQNGNLSTMTLPFNQTGSGRTAGSITTYGCPNANKGNEIYLNGGSKVAFWQVRDNATSIPMAVDNGSELILSITYMTA